MRTFTQLPDYDIVKRIGKGAGAVIYSARRKSSREEFAVKHVVRKGAEDDKFLQQAEAEYEIAHKLNHPVLRKYHDLVRVRRWLKTQEMFLVMELVYGETLEERHKNQAPPEDVSNLVSQFIQVAEGLHAMHVQGYVHADIKPNNIMLAGAAVKVIDFGQSCPLGHRKERVQGTPDFIAPEQVQREPLDQRTDVFNLGASMYWAMTGKWLRTMMNAGIAGARKDQIDLRSGNESPEQVNPHVPLGLARLIMECCEPRMADRPREMKTVASRLELLLQLMRKKRGDGA